MNPEKEEEKDKEGGDEYEVAGRGALPASPECLLRRCLLMEPLFFLKKLFTSLVPLTFWDLSYCTFYFFSPHCQLTFGVIYLLLFIHYIYVYKIILSSCFLKEKKSNNPWVNFGKEKAE